MQSKGLAQRVVSALRRGEGRTAALNIELRHCAEGRAEISMLATSAMSNGLGTVHGGILFTLADTAFAYACNSRNVATVAQAASISFLSPGRVGERMTAKAVETATNGRSGVYGVHIMGEDGRMIAIFQGLSRSLGRSVIDMTTGDLIDG